MAKNRDRDDSEGRDEDFEGDEESDEELSDDEFGDDGPVDFDSDEVLDDPEFEDEGDEEGAVAARPAKRRVAAKKVPTVEGVPRTRLDKADVAAEVWEKMKGRHGEGAAEPYSIRSTFRNGDVIDHKAFGIGFVLEVHGPGKIEVLFHDGLRKLVHGK
jgi:hypothetical protein